MMLPDPPVKPIALPPILSVRPSQLEAAIAAFGDAVDRLSPLISEGKLALRVEPWMGDPVSIELARAMTEQHTVGPNSIIGVLEAYQAELQRVVDTLTQMLQSYHGADADAAQAIKR